MSRVFGSIHTAALDDGANDPDEAYEKLRQDEIDDAPRVADCDACGKRPGTHTVVAFGIETWACDVCTGRAPD